MGSHVSNGTEVTAPELLYPIGEVARLTGVSQGLLRLWEREELIRPQRTAGGHRFYTHKDIVRLRRIIHLRRVERLNVAAIRRELGGIEKAPLAAEAPQNEQPEGLRLRSLRSQLGLSLAEVADKTGLSISFLSAVERGHSSISLGNLFKLADAYGTTVPGLNPEYRDEQRIILHSSDRPRFVGDNGRVMIEDLITQACALEAQRIEIQPGGGSDKAYAHPGEEFIYILTGELEFWIDENAQYHLQAGDSLYLLSTQFHRWRNESSTVATVLWINVPVIETSANDREQRGKAYKR